MPRVQGKILAYSRSLDYDDEPHKRLPEKTAGCTNDGEVVCPDCGKEIINLQATYKPVKQKYWTWGEDPYGQPYIPAPVLPEPFVPEPDIVEKKVVEPVVKPKPKKRKKKPVQKKIRAPEMTRRVRWQ